MIAQAKTFVIPSKKDQKRIVKTSEKWKRFLATMCIENVYGIVYYVEGKQIWRGVVGAFFAISLFTELYLSAQGG